MESPETSSIKCLLIADDDSLIGRLPLREDVDLVISLGDLHDQTLMRVVDTHAPEYALAVRGNHCVSTPPPKPFIDLHLKVITIAGITFGGFSGSWQYKAQGNYLYSQDDVHDALLDFPPVDVFIAHNSPRTIHERDTGVHQGFDGFLDYIHRTEPRYFFHGHQHVNVVSTVGKTQVIGVYGERLRQISKNKC